MLLNIINYLPIHVIYQLITHYVLDLSFVIAVLRLLHIYYYSAIINQLLHTRLHFNLVS